MTAATTATLSPPINAAAAVDRWPPDVASAGCGVGTAPTAEPQAEQNLPTAGAPHAGQ
jgi:hypothetical protein